MKLRKPKRRKRVWRELERKPDALVRITLPGRPVTRTITPAQVTRYLNTTDWTVEGGPIFGPRDRSIPLTRIIGQIAFQEGRSPGEVLADIAANRGMLRLLRSRARWRSFP